MPGERSTRAPGLRRLPRGARGPDRDAKAPESRLASRSGPRGLISRPRTRPPSQTRPQERQRRELTPLAHHPPDREPPGGRHHAQRRHRGPAGVPARPAAQLRRCSGQPVQVRQVPEACHPDPVPDADSLVAHDRAREPDGSARVPSEHPHHPDRLPRLRRQLQTRQRKWARRSRPVVQRRCRSGRCCKDQGTFFRAEHSGNGSVARHGSGFHLEIHAALQDDSREVVVRRGDAERPAVGSEPLVRTGAVRADRHPGRPVGAT